MLSSSRDFSNTETLCSEYKYYCETCCSKQEAQKRSVQLWTSNCRHVLMCFWTVLPPCRMRVKKLPMILALHLKRFKYMEQLHRYTKLSYRVVFPLELRLFNTSGDAVNLDRMYDLVAVVVHCGRYSTLTTGPQQPRQETPSTYKFRLMIIFLYFLTLDLILKLNVSLTQA